MIPLTNNSDVFIKPDALCRKEWNMNEMRGQDEMMWVKHLKRTRWNDVGEAFKNVFNDNVV